MNDRHQQAFQEEARELLVERALEYLKNLEATSARNRDLQLELAQAYTKIGLVQAGKGEASLGDFTGAVASYEHARAILHAVLQRSPGDEPAAEAALAFDILIEMDARGVLIEPRRGHVLRFLDRDAVNVVDALADLVIAVEIRTAGQRGVVAGKLDRRAGFAQHFGGEHGG